MDSWKISPANHILNATDFVHIPLYKCTKNNSIHVYKGAQNMYILLEKLNNKMCKNVSFKGSCRDSMSGQLKKKIIDFVAKVIKKT